MDHAYTFLMVEIRGRSNKGLECSGGLHIQHPLGVVDLVAGYVYAKYGAHLRVGTL